MVPQNCQVFRPRGAGCDIIGKEHLPTPGAAHAGQELSRYLPQAV